MSSKTYRVQGIPSNYTKEDTRILLTSIFQRDDNPDPIIHSLAIDPSSSINNRFQTATIAFRQDPRVLQDNKGDWILPDQRSRFFNRIPSIKVDNHFLGFTPLNSFENDENHTIE